MRYWRWKTTEIDFSKLPKEFACSFKTKVELIFSTLPAPDNNLHDIFIDCANYRVDEDFFRLVVFWAIEYNLIETCDFSQLVVHSN